MRVHIFKIYDAYFVVFIEFLLIWRAHAQLVEDYRIASLDNGVRETREETAGFAVLPRGGRWWPCLEYSPVVEIDSLGYSLFLLVQGRAYTAFFLDSNLLCAHGVLVDVGVL